VLTRVEIELEHDSEAVISALPSNPNELKISFPDLILKSALPLTKEPTAQTTVADKQVPDSVANVELSTLTGISVDNNSIKLSIIGEVSDFKTFRLNKPERFVIDLLNVKSGLPTRLLPLNASGVASARIGLYPDKVRVVLDAVNGNFPEAVAAKNDSGVVITLVQPVGDDNRNTKLTSTRVDKPVEAAVADASSSSAPIVEKTETKSNPAKETQIESKLSDIKPSVVKKVDSDFEKPQLQKSKADKKISTTSSIEMIDFQVIDGISRISIKINGDIKTDKPVKSAGYVTLNLNNTSLPKKLQRSLETRSFISPVLRITPVSVKTKKGVDTKIRISTRIVAPFEVRQEGDMLYVDFKHEGMSSDKLFSETVIPNKAILAKTSPAREEDSSSDISPLVESPAKSSGNVHGYKGRKVTLEFADAEVRKIFQLLSEVSNKNFVLGDEVTGAISLKLVNVPWDQALDIILDTKGLDKREDGNIILIKGKGKFKSQAEEELEIKRTAAKSIELKTETFSVNYADLGDITSQFEKLKTPDRGQIASDKRTSKVIVKDTPQALSDMRALLSQLDLPERQVMIEARIVEATSTFSRNLGINWGVHQRDGSAAFLGINSLDTAFGGIASAPPTSGVGTAAGASMGISFGTLANNIKIDTRLSAAASAGMVKIISSPKVATLNHKPAKISQGQQIPYQNTTATTGAVTAFVAATLSLEVTPHINANGTIVMKIDAKNDAPGTGSPPPINTKQATTELLLKDGETTVIGGIYVDSDQEGDEGVPYLMDIPFIGSLFKSNSKSKTKTELLIFITPRILGSV
jgi:type IV pilus assembly protein PilQ